MAKDKKKTPVKKEGKKKKDASKKAPKKTTGGKAPSKKADKKAPAKRPTKTDKAKGKGKTTKDKGGTKNREKGKEATSLAVGAEAASESPVIARGMNKAAMKRRSKGSKQVAVIGGGFAGTGVAYYLRDLYENRFESTLFERNSYLGGRTAVTSIGGETVEIGGSVLIPSFQHTNKLIKEFDYKKDSPYVTKKIITGLWDGEAFVYKANTKHWWNYIILALDTLERYGAAPITVTKLAKKIEDQFEGLYKKQIKHKETWDNPMDLFDELKLTEFLKTTTEDYLVNEARVDREYVDQLVTGITRALNGQAPTVTNAFSGIAAQVGSIVETYAVKGGNYQLTEEMATKSKATVRLETKVTKIAANGDGFDVTYQRIAPMDPFGRYSPELPPEQVTEYFDYLAIASPFEVLGIEWEGVELPEIMTKGRDMQVVYEAFVVGKLNPKYFEVDPEDMPDMVVTMDNPDIPFAALMYVAKIKKAQRLYKVFALNEISDELIHSVFMNVSETAKLVWNPAYPVAAPIEEFAPFKVADNIVYLSAMEQVTSSIEVSLISAYNGAQLLGKQIKKK